MSDQVLTNIAELLTQEKWTRATLGSFTTQAFRDLDVQLEQIFELKVQDEVLLLCEEHLKQSKHSITGLYLSGIIKLNRQSIDDANLIILINQFTEAGRWKIAEWLAERILEFGENRHAYRTLSDCYREEKREDKKFEVWEKLIRVDFEEADIVLELAERAESQGQPEAAVSYYKKALHRFINKKIFNSVRDIWKKLISLCPEDTDFFLHAENKVAKILSEDRAVMLLEDLYPSYKNAQKWDLAIDLIKRIVQYDPKNPIARNEIIECYKKRYEGHSQLAEYIRLSNLSATWRNVHEAIADFEKHIAFDTGNYVFHRTWGVGLINSIKDDTITIDFPKNKGHKMALKLAVSALTILGKEHFWVHRITTRPEKLKERILKDPVWALKIIIRSFGNQADMKKIKAEVADSHILDQNAWTSWSVRARNILKTDESFGNLPDKPDVFMVRDQPVSLEEKTYNRFKAEKDFFARLKILQEFLAWIELQTASVDSDLFRDIFEYFVNYVRNMTQVTEQTLASMLVVRRIIESFNFLNPGVNLNFREVIEAIGDDVDIIFEKLANTDLRRDFLVIVRRYHKGWVKTYLKLFPLHPSREAIGELVKAGAQAELQQLFQNSFSSYRDNRELVVWFLKNCSEEQWFVELAIPDERQIIALIHLYEITQREIENKKDVSENRRINKMIGQILFREGKLLAFLKSADQASVTRVYSLIADARSVDPEAYKQASGIIKQRFPGFKLPGESEKERETDTVSRSTGFYTLLKSLEEKQKGLQYLQDVEVPKNSKEIAAAREYGDLRENAEYKAAKERQEILNSTAARWKGEIEQAKPFNPEDLDSVKVGFGTVVTLHNILAKSDETFTIMGPWESDPESGVISYLSPFGMEIYRKSVGDVLKFTINDREYQYKVKKIVKAQFEKIKTTTQVTI